MKTLLTSLCLSLLLAAPAWAISFNFGVSPSITVLANQPVSIPAAITNTSDTAMEFGCAISTCEKLDFGAGINSGPGEGLNALNFTFGSGPNTFNAQFVGVVLAPANTFNFTFGTINFDPSIPDGNPLGTVLHPEFGFVFRNPQVTALTLTPVTIAVGEHVSFAPPTFMASVATPVTSVPLPSMWWPTLLGFVGLAGLVAWRRSPSAA
jgi:predicted permease